jgi:nucleotide-binding universal stress UspA family protein
MTDHTHPVLVGIDGTASGLEGLALGSALAVLTGSPLLLAAVYGYETDFVGEFVWPPERLAQGWLDEASERMGTAIPWRTCAIPSSSPAHGLTTLATRESAGLIVLGSSRTGHLDHVLLGPTARRVVHGAPCAVAVAPHGWRLRPSEAPIVIGAGVTESDESHAALALAARLANTVHAPVRVLNVAHFPSPAHPMFAATGTSFEAWCGDARAQAQRVARDAIETLNAAVETEIVVPEGDPVARLAEASRDLDLLVVGSRRYGPLRGVLLGSVSASLIDRAACPVVIVPRGVHPESHLRDAAGDVVHA